VLCLCPNHHVLLDAGSLFIRDDLTVVDALNGSELGLLATQPSHSLSMDSIAYHRDHWTSS
jgi:putative restriction endonuclease